MCLADRAAPSEARPATTSGPEGPRVVIPDASVGTGECRLVPVASLDGKHGPLRLMVHAHRDVKPVEPRATRALDLMRDQHANGDAAAEPAPRAAEVSVQMNSSLIGETIAVAPLSGSSLPLGFTWIISPQPGVAFVLHLAAGPAYSCCQSQYPCSRRPRSPATSRLRQPDGFEGPLRGLKKLSADQLSLRMRIVASTAALTISTCSIAPGALRRSQH